MKKYQFQYICKKRMIYCIGLLFLRKKSCTYIVRNVPKEVRLT